MGMAGTNVCLDLSCHSFPPSRDRSLLNIRGVMAPQRGEIETVRFFGRQSSIGWMPEKIKRLSVGVKRRHPVTKRKVSLMGLLIG